MLISILLLLFGLLLLYAGAEGLVRGSAALAVRLGITPLVIGLTVVAFGTSTPEMVVSVGAALSGQGGIAAGNVVGSNISNIALILGLSALVYPLATQVRIIRIDLPLMLLASIVLAGMLANQSLGRAEGGVLFAGFVAYIAFTVRAARREKADAQQAFQNVLPKQTGGLFLNGVLIFGGLLLLVAGSRFLVMGAVAIAEAAGLSEAVIGLTIIAVGTSLPELATSILAALKKEADIALGNIVGSNLFNILGILGLSALVKPLANTGLTRVDLGVMILLAVVLLPLARSGWKIARWEGGLLFAAYVSYVVYLLV